jgi:hypothetical protein
MRADAQVLEAVQHGARSTGWRLLRTVLFFGFWGPLVGGLPYVWMVVTIPFAYVFGGVPALVCGWLYGLWQSASDEDVGALARAGCGAVCGLLGCIFYAAVLGRLELTGMLALHGMPAGAVLGWWRRG